MSGDERYSRLSGGCGETGLASELEGNLLDGGGLGEVEDYVTAKEGGVDVDASAAETKDVGVDVDLEVGVPVRLLAVRHVVSVVGPVGARVLALVAELWGRGEDVGLGVEGAEGSMESGGERVLLGWMGRSGRAGEYIRHCEKSRTEEGRWKKKGSVADRGRGASTGWPRRRPRVGDATGAGGRGKGRGENSKGGERRRRAQARERQGAGGAQSSRTDADRTTAMARSPAADICFPGKVAGEGASQAIAVLGRPRALRRGARRCPPALQIRSRRLPSPSALSANLISSDRLITVFDVMLSPCAPRSAPSGHFRLLPGARSTRARQRPRRVLAGRVARAAACRHRRNVLSSLPPLRPSRSPLFFATAA